MGSQAPCPWLVAGDVSEAFAPRAAALRFLTAALALPPACDPPNTHMGAGGRGPQLSGTSRALLPLSVEALLKQVRGGTSRLRWVCILPALCEGGIM